jgi:hypothetical protein
MDIICDTHIWYGIGWGLIDLTPINATDRLVGSYNNIDELCSTQKLVDKPEYVVKAIQVDRRNQIIDAGQYSYIA